MDISKIGIDFDTFKTFVNSSDLAKNGENAVWLKGANKQVLAVGDTVRRSGCTQEEFASRKVSQQKSGKKSGKKAEPKSEFEQNLSRYQDNICLRGQLLTAVRSELGGETSEAFKEIEQDLFGTGNPFDVQPGSTDLTVRDIQIVLNKVSNAQMVKAFNSVALPAFNELLQTQCPTGTSFEHLNAEGLKKLCEDEHAYKDFAAKFGPELAAQAKALGRQVLITEHLADLERRAHSPVETSKAMLKYVQDKMLVDCDLGSLLSGDVKFEDEDLKNYILMACKAHVNGLVSSLKDVENELGGEEKKDLRQAEIRKIFSSNNVTSLEGGTAKEFESVLIAFVKVHDKKWLFMQDSDYSDYMNYDGKYEKLTQEEVLTRAKAILKKVVSMDNKELADFGDKFGNDIALQADALGQAMLISEHLLQLEFIAQDPTKTKEDMAVYLKKKTYATSHANSLEELTTDGERKQYTVRLCKTHVYTLINALKEIEKKMKNVETKMKNDGKTDDEIKSVVEETHEEMVRGVFRANDGTCLELRTDNLERALVAPPPSTKPLVHELSEIFSTLCKDEGVRIFSEILAHYNLDVKQTIENKGYSNDDLENYFQKRGQLNQKTFDVLMDDIKEKYAEVQGDKDKKKLFEDCLQKGWNEFKDVFKSYLMSNVAGQRREAFTLEKVDNKWNVNLLVDQNNKPIMKNVTNAEIEEMSDQFFEFCKDDPYINSEYLGPEKRVQVKTSDERVRKPGHTYFEEMKTLAKQYSNEYSNVELNEIIQDVSNELKRYGMNDSELWDLAWKVESELHELRNQKDEKSYSKEYWRFIDDLFCDGLLTNRERMVKLIENRIFYNANVETYEYQPVGGQPPRTVKIPTERAMKRYLKPSAMKLASVLMLKWPERFKGYKTCHDLAVHIVNGCLSMRKDGYSDILARFVSSTGRMKIEPAHENIISSVELKPMEDISSSLIKYMNSFFV